MRLPPFNPSDPAVWFKQAEISFTLSAVEDELVRYSIVVGNLDTAYASTVSEVILNIPAATPYTKLKEALVKRFTSSRESEIRQLVSQQQIGDRTPMQFLRHLRTLAKSDVPDGFLRTLWESHLPDYVRSILATQPADVPLDDVANLADKVFESVRPRTVAAVSNPNAEFEAKLEKMREEHRREIRELTAQVAALAVNAGSLRPRHRSQTPSRRRSRTRSHSRGPPNDNHCWYHQIFGAEARKCKQPCTFKKENPSGGQQ